jgi:hypothetical protein
MARHFEPIADTDEVVGKAANAGDSSAVNGVKKLVRNPQGPHNHF